MDPRNDDARDPRITRKYRIERLVAEGGMGRVFEARRRRDQRRVAIKILHGNLATDERCRRHMLREAHALAVAAHPSVVEFIEYGETSKGLPFLVLEWLEGRSLHANIVDDGPMPMPRIARLFTSLLDALELVHTRGIVHADIKPENVMLVTGPDGRETPRLVDFGVASVGPLQAAPPGEVYGTPGYLAPEVITGGAPTPGSDLYAAGIVLFEMLTGCAPFVAGSLAELLEQQVGRLPKPSDYRLGCTPAIDALVARALAPEPENRFADAAALRAAVRAAFGSLRAAAAPASLRAQAKTAQMVKPEPPTARWKAGKRRRRHTLTWVPVSSPGALVAAG